MAAAPATSTPRIAVKRTFYPAVLQATSSEVAEHKRRKKKWFMHHKDAWKRTERYVQAKKYLSKASYKKSAMQAGLFVTLVGLAAFWFWGDDISKALRSGFKGATVTVPGVNPWGVALLYLQGGASTCGYLLISERKKRTKAKLDKDRYEEWLRREEVKQDDLQHILLPVYAEPNPYDPTDPSINVVIGEYNDNDAHKFGPVAHWYAMKMKGLQTGGVIIFGVTGTGKTSSTLRPIMRQILGWMAHVDYDPDNKGREKVAAFILDPKGSLSYEAAKPVAATAGTDPVLDFRQLNGDGPANITALYHLLHQAKGRFDEKGNPIFDPEVIRQYRGRMDDYMELGYDELKVEKVWAQLHSFQEASRALGGSSPRERNGWIYSGWFRMQHELLRPNGQEGASDEHPLVTYLKGGKVNISRPVLSSINVELDRVDWRDGIDKTLGALIEPLGADIEHLLRWVWVGRRDACPKEPGRQANTSLLVHPMAPGTPFSQAFALDSYAISRNLIRRFAPLKVRPTHTTNEYRDAWAWREQRLWDFHERQLQAARSAEAAARLFALVRRLPLPGLNRLDREQGEAYGTRLAEDLRVLSTPLDQLVGASSVAWEYGRPKAQPSGTLLAALDRIRTSLDPKLANAFREGNYQALTVPLSERPTPLPVDAQKEKRLGGRYAAPDPLVQLVVRVGELRKEEHALVQEMVKVAGASFAQAGGETATAVAGWAEYLADQLVGKGGKVTVPLPEFLNASLEAALCASGGMETLFADAVSTVLGMPTVARPEASHALGSYLLYGDQSGSFGLPAAMGALSPVSHDLPAFIRPAMDAVAEDWSKRPLGPAVAAAQSYLAASGLSEVERDRLSEVFRGALKQLVDGWVHAHLAVVEEHLERGPSAERLRALGAKGKEVFQEAHRLGQLGALAGYVDDPLGITPAERQAKFRKGKTPSTFWGSLLWSPAMSPSGARRGPFWRGVMAGSDMTPLHAAQWDPAWGSILWRLLGYSLGAVPTGIEPLRKLAELGTVLGLYHQAALEGFAVTVAPNIGWRTDGPFAYNPLFAPDLAPIIVAGTFNDTVFAATSEGKDSGDPFWQNASFGTVFNILNLLNQVDGYATFPKIDALVTNEQMLRDYLEVIRDRVARRDGTPQDLEDMTNILRWADGEWLTEASSKSETKDNIVRSLSVVTQPFKDPRFALVFAPAAKEDISFPSWSWVMREGKIVAANLPYEKYEKVAKVVLPLANKTFQKAVQMRDGNRSVNGTIAANNRNEIKELWRQADELRQEINGRAAERLVLSLFFERPEQSGMVKMLTGDHLLVQWRGAASSSKGVLRPVPTMADPFVMAARVGSGSLEGVAAFVAGAVGKAKPLEGAYLLAPRSIQAGIEAGFFMRMVGHQEATLGRMAEEGHEAARSLLAVFDRIAKTRPSEETLTNLRLLGIKDGAEVARGARELPGTILESLDLLLGREALVRLTSRLKNLHSDDRSGQERGGGDQGAHGASLRPRVRLREIYRKIRDLEAQIQEMPNTERQVMYLVDEAHFFVQGKEDAQYVSVARSANALNFYSTQSPNGLMAKMDEAVAKQFLDSLPNRIILRMPDSKAAEACAEYLGGKRRVRVVEKNINQSFDDVRADAVEGGGRGKSTGGSVSVNIKEEERWVVDLNAITNLQAMEAFVMVWDGKRNTPPRRVYLKPDYLFTVPHLRSYKRDADPRYSDLPAEYQDGTDLYALTVPRLLDLGVIDASR